MTTSNKSTDQSVQEMISDYDAVEQNQPADTTPGTVNRDIIDTTGQQVSTTYSEIEQVRLPSSLRNAGLVSEGGLSQFGLNFDLVQSGAVEATGTIYFQKTTVPTTIVDFPAGTIVQTRPSTTGSSTKFVTLTATRLSPSTTLNPANRKYEVSAPIIAVVAGADGNVGPGSINTLATPNRNIDSIVNKEATSGGTDVESNTDFATRILARTDTTDFGTKTGYISLVSEQFPDLLEVAVAGPGDTALVRRQFGNEADLYIIGASNSTFTDTITVSGASSDLLITHPVVSISSVVGVTNSGVYVPGVDVQFTKDTSAAYGGSIQAFDRLTWLSANRPGATQQIRATGLYDATVGMVQDYLDSDDVRFVTADVLAKAATRIGVVVTASATAFSGYDRTSLANTAQLAVINGLTNFTLGQSISQSDIVSLIGNVSGIDKVQIPLTEFRKSTESAGTVSDSVEIPTSSYARADTITITVS